MEKGGTVLSFFDLQRFRREQDRNKRAARDLKLAEERIEHLKWQQRNDDYDREQQDHQEQRRRENEKETRMNLFHSANALQDDLADLKLRRKFCIEEGE